jgi:hypothetical protein
MASNDNLGEGFSELPALSRKHVSGGLDVSYVSAAHLLHFRADAPRLKRRAFLIL